MGYGSWTASSWDSYKTTKGYDASSTVHDMYKSKKVKDEFEPLSITIRESCDSNEHPNSTPIILALDVTGSMDRVLENISKRLNVLLKEIYNKKPVDDPQVMFMAIGDTTCDDHPLQVTQFESDIRIAEQLNDIYFERGGGGNDGESYTLAWYFAARHTKIDSFEKHNKKGIIFTIGDEPWLDTISKEDIKAFVGDTIQADLTAEQLLTEVSRQYEVYHLVIEEGSYCRYYGDDAKNKWISLIGQRTIPVSDCEKIPEIIVSILEVMNGKNKADVVKGWDGSTSVVVQKAIKDIVAVSNEKNGLIEF